MEPQRRISLGSESLDQQLNGGLIPSELTLIYGEPGSGKTTLLLSAAAHLLKRDAGSKVILIDTDSKFTPTRFIQMLGSEEPLRRFIYTRPTTFNEQAEATDHLPEQLSSGDLVLVDSATGLYRVETSDTQKTFAENKELNRQLGSLKEIAITSDVAVVMTGQVRSILDSQVPAVEPVAPRLLRYWSDKVIKLENTATQGVKQATIEKPPHLRGAIRFRVTEKGLEDDIRW